MGCTSSAPNSIANVNKEDKSIQFEDDAEDTVLKHDAIDTHIKKRTEIKVLPPSDNIAEPVQLVRNNKSTTSLDPVKDLHTNGHIVETDQTDTSETKEEKEDKIAKLEEVVGKFIEITQQDINHDKEESDANNTEHTDITGKDNSETDLKMEDSKESEDEHDNNSEHDEEASPSQSQSSRATRWEALADIAAELPPSLAVDPITGQIYSLSK